MIGRGNGCVTTNGYRVLSRIGHPAATNRGQIMEHTLVMYEMIGRKLNKNESIHHKNGDRLDNRPENLELWSRFQPAGQRVADKIKYAIEILETYADMPREWPAEHLELAVFFKETKNVDV